MPNPKNRAAEYHLYYDWGVRGNIAVCLPAASGKSGPTTEGTNYPFRLIAFKKKIGCHETNGAHPQLRGKHLIWINAVDIIRSSSGPLATVHADTLASLPLVTIQMPRVMTWIHSRETCSVYRVIRNMSLCNVLAARLILTIPCLPGSLKEILKTGRFTGRLLEDKTVNR